MPQTFLSKWNFLARTRARNAAKNSSGSIEAVQPRTEPAPARFENGVSLDTPVIAGRVALRRRSSHAVDRDFGGEAGEPHYRGPSREDFLRAREAPPQMNALSLVTAIKPSI